MDTDIAIVGGGLVGLAVAWGLLKLGQRVTVIDGADTTLSASRGNFGLVWVQGKGTRAPAYARWSQHAAGLWSGFASELQDATGIDLELQQDGGLDLHFSEDSLQEWVSKYEGLRDALGGDYPYEVLRGDDLRREEPEIGPKVVGGILHQQDGHVNPLRLLRALDGVVRNNGARVMTGANVETITKPDGFRLTLEDGATVTAGKVVLAAGLGSAKLGRELGFLAPVTPERGQILITEKLPKLIRRPSLIARQVGSGGVQIGATNETVGLNDDVTIKGIAQLASEAVAAYPILAQAQLLRSWGALRVMTPDGLPIYAESETMPGAYLITCHSGVTLASTHALLLPAWLVKNSKLRDLEVFGETRFAV